MSGALMEPELQADLDAIAGIEAVPAILEMICRATGMGFAAVARVTETRWIACAVRDDIAFGLKPGGELNIETTICNEIRASGQRVVIDAVSSDDAFRTHHTPALYGFESYISVPIRRRDGTFFGTLCAIDPRAAQLKRPEITGMFEQFAELIAYQLEAREALQESRLALATERAIADTREQFIAVLGHDLRNPLASIDAAARMLRKQARDGHDLEVLDILRKSVGRMAELIDNVTDLARGRLGGGIAITSGPIALLGPALVQVIEEFRVAWPDRSIIFEMALDAPVAADPARVAQLLSNLVSNALTHGDPAGATRVSATSDAEGFALTVANVGEPIPAATQQRLFQPFFRGEVRPGSQGLGLGLYIAAEIARAHGGSLSVDSCEAETRFTFRIPPASPA